MARRKIVDTLDKKRRRTPFTAKIKREDPFYSADHCEIQAMCRRIAAPPKTIPPPAGAKKAAPCSTT